MQIAIDSIYTVKIARCSAIYTTCCKYMHLSIVVHYKTVRNNNVLSVNYSFNSNYMFLGEIMI